jgi:hypothetical protein
LHNAPKAWYKKVVLLPIVIKDRNIFGGKKEAMMEKCSRVLLAICFAISASLLAALPASAQTNADIEAQIKALEQEVQKIEPLKDQIERLRSQQLELKKEATSAAAQMPTFQYRQGRGLTISGADKSWSINTSARFNIYNYNILGGKTNWNDNGTERSGNTTAGELYPRRARIYTTFCWQDCFYQFEHSIDGETAERSASFRDNEFSIDFSQLNPWLPKFSVGLRRGAGRTHIARSSDNDGKVEHSIILDGFAWGGDGSHAGMGLAWEGVDIGPGEYELYLNYITSRQGTWQEFINSDRKGLMMFIGGKPFSEWKSKWISGLEVGFGYQGHSVERAENNLTDDTSGVEIRVRNAERRGRQDLFRPGVVGGAFEQNIGAGWGHVMIPGLKWVVGPYMFRAVYVTTRYANRDPGIGSGIWGRGWTMDNQLMVWSPKGFLTGSQTTPNTIMMSFGFERADMDCGRSCDASPSTGSFHRQTVLNREVALWYWLQPSLGIGAWWHYWSTDNTPYRTQVNVGCKDSRTEALAGKGVSRSCDWHSFNTGLRYRW